MSACLLRATKIEGHARFLSHFFLQLKLDTHPSRFPLYPLNYGIVFLLNSSLVLLSDNVVCSS